MNRQSRAKDHQLERPADSSHTDPPLAILSQTPIAEVFVSSTAPATIEELFAEFQELGDWDAQCDYLIDLGHELPKLPQSAKVDANRVYGCQSNVWMDIHTKPGDPPTVEFVANSDAIIVNGLIAVLMAMYDGRTPQEILNTDAKAIFARLGLERHLSSQRRNGLFGMVERVRRFATEAAVQGGAA